MKLLEDFTAFAMKGNIIDLAVVVIIGTSFGKIVSSLVDAVFMPLIGVFLGGLDFTKLAFAFGSISIQYGMFIQSIVDFIIISFVIFVVLRALSKIKGRKNEEPTPIQEPSEEIQLLREIHDSLKR